MNDANKKANPAPLGLLGFGMTTILLNLHNTGIIELSIVIVAMGIALGGLAQIIAGIMEFKAGNTFGATAFVAYGTFWWSLVLIWILPVSNPADSMSMGFYLLLWCAFTAFMFVGTLEHTITSQVVFGTLTFLFLFLSLAEFTESSMLRVVAGIIGIVCGAAAIYNAMGQLVNEEYDREVFKL